MLYADAVKSLEETKSLESLDKVVSALNTSFLNAAKVNTTPEAKGGTEHDDRINNKFPGIIVDFKF